MLYWKKKKFHCGSSLQDNFNLCCKTLKIQFHWNFNRDTHQVNKWTNSTEIVWLLIPKMYYYLNTVLILPKEFQNVFSVLLRFFFSLQKVDYPTHVNNNKKLSFSCYGFLFKLYRKRLNNGTPFFGMHVLCLCMKYMHEKGWFIFLSVYGN